jgi:hypothetical protein
MKTATLTLQQDYHSSIAANISAGEAYEKISRVNEWWALNFEGSAQKAGDIFTVRFGDTFVTFKITEAIDSKKYTWHVTECFLPWLNDKTEWTGTDVVFEITHDNNFTKIDMTHVGLVPGAECYDRCEKGWDYFIKESLFRFITKGNGMPEGTCEE